MGCYSIFDVEKWDEKTLAKHLEEPQVIAHVSELLKTKSGCLSPFQYLHSLLRKDITYPEKQLVDIITCSEGLIENILFPVIEDTRLSTSGLIEIAQSMHSKSQIGTARSAGSMDHYATRMQNMNSSKMRGHENVRIRVVTKIYWFMNHKWLKENPGKKSSYLNVQTLSQTVRNMLVEFDNQTQLNSKWEMLEKVLENQSSGTWSELLPATTIALQPTS